MVSRAPTPTPAFGIFGISHIKRAKLKAAHDCTVSEHCFHSIEYRTVALSVCDIHYLFSKLRDQADEIRCLIYMVRLEVHVNNTLLRKLQRDQIGPGYSENFVIGWLIISILSTHVTVIFSSYSLLFTNSILQYSTVYCSALKPGYLASYVIGRLICSRDRNAGLSFAIVHVTC